MREIVVNTKACRWRFGKARLRLLPDTWLKVNTIFGGDPGPWMPNGSPSKIDRSYVPGSMVESGVEMIIGPSKMRAALISVKEN